MLDGEWRLDYPGVSLSMGGWDPVANPFRLPPAIGHRSAPSLGDVTVTTDDSDQPRGDGVRFGQDFRGGRTITFDLAIRAPSEAQVLALTETVAEAWRPDSIRFIAGEYATLSTRNAGRERMVYGRPRKFTPDDALRKQGLVTVQATFDTIGDLFYDVADTGMSMGFVSPSNSGITTPVVTPVTTTPITTTPGAIRVGGRKPVWVVSTIWGPIINPTVRVTNAWSLTLGATIDAGESVTLDPRPWRQQVVRSDGASFAGALTRSSRLDKATLAPGTYEVSMTGVDNTGLSRLQVAWRHAYTGL